MPTLDDQFAAAQQAYLDNVPPFQTADQCTLFIQACARLLALQPNISGSREGHTQFDMKLIQQAQKDAQDWLDAYGPLPGGLAATNGRPTQIVRASLVHFRD